VRPAFIQAVGAVQAGTLMGSRRFERVPSG